MGKLLGIDYGLKRTGLAITDDLQIIASPYETIESKIALDYIEKLVIDQNIEAIVLGEPRYLDGSESQMTKNVHAFQAKLAKKCKVPIYLEDEAFTSQIAADTMLAAGYKKKKRRDKGNLDKISAALILQSYMEKTN